MDNSVPGTIVDETDPAKKKRLGFDSNSYDPSPVTPSTAPVQNNAVSAPAKSLANPVGFGTASPAYSPPPAAPAAPLAPVPEAVKPLKDYSGQAGQAYTAPQPQPATSLTDRYNNPGAVEYQPWMAKYGATPGANGRYAQFPSQEHGYAAMGDVLNTYRTKYGINSVNGVVNRWAPSNVDHNDTNGYARFVSRQLGVDPNAPLTPEHWQKLPQAMAAFEAGHSVPAFPVPVATTSPPQPPAGFAKPMAFGLASFPPSDAQIQQMNLQAQGAFSRANQAMNYSHLGWANGVANVLNTLGGLGQQQQAAEGLKARQTQSVADNQRVIDAATNHNPAASGFGAPRTDPNPQQQTAPAPSTVQSTAQTGGSATILPLGLASTPPTAQGGPQAPGLAAPAPTPQAPGLAGPPPQKAPSPASAASPPVATAAHQPPPDPRAAEIDNQLAGIDNQIRALAPMMNNPQTAAQAQQMFTQLQARRQHFEDMKLARSDPGERLRLEALQQQVDEGKNKIQVVGQDPFSGANKYAWVDPVNRTTSPIEMNGAAASGAQMDPNIHGEEFLKTLPPPVASELKGYAEGRLPYPTGAAALKPQWLARERMLQQYDPNFDASQYASRAALRKNYMGGGKQFQELQSISTVAGHLHDLKDSADKLSQGGITGLGPLNSVANMGRTALLSASQDPRLTDFNIVKQAVATELGKAYKGGQVTEGEIKEWEGNINNAASPAQLKVAIGRLNKLLDSKRNALEESYRSNMGHQPLPQDFSTVNDRTRGLFADVDQWANGDRAAPAAAGNYPGVEGAKQAPDGNWYVPDPNRPGKYLQVQH